VLDRVHLEDLYARTVAEEQRLGHGRVGIERDLADHRAQARVHRDDAGDVRVVHAHRLGGEVMQRIAALLLPGGAAGEGRDLDHLTTLGAHLEGDRHPGRLGLPALLADEVEEVDVGLVRHAVEPVDHHLRHPGEELDEGHAGVCVAQVGPLGTVLGDQGPGFADDVVVPAVIEIWRTNRHVSTTRRK